MANFQSRLSTRKVMHLIVVKVVSIDVPVKEPVHNIKIEWERGDLKI